MHNRFRNIHLIYNMRERSESLCIFVSHAETYDYFTLYQPNTHYSSGNINIACKNMFELNCHFWPLSNYFGIRFLSFWNLVQHGISLTVNIIIIIIIIYSTKKK